MAPPGHGLKVFDLQSPLRCKALWEPSPTWTRPSIHGRNVDTVPHKFPSKTAGVDTVDTIRLGSPKFDKHKGKRYELDLQRQQRIGHYPPIQDSQSGHKFCGQTST